MTIPRGHVIGERGNGMGWDGNEQKVGGGNVRRLVREGHPAMMRGKLRPK